MTNLDRRFDAIVIGSGPGGSSAVAELTERGLEVLLLEAGRELREEDFAPAKGKPKAAGMDLFARGRAMASGQYRQACRPWYSETTGRFLVNDFEDPYSTPHGRPYLWVRGKVLGGRMNSYGRVLQRMSDVDFKAASRDGYGTDWPISYAELAPWYEQVERRVGVYGDADGLELPPDGHYAGPGFLSTAEKQFKAKVEARWPERRVISWRVQAPFVDRVPPGIRDALATGRLTIRTSAQVTRITVDDRTGLATGAVFVDRETKAQHQVFADAVVVCASTIESIRLLLNSGSTKHPDGLGNSSGLLGRYFMDQTVSIGFFDDPSSPGAYEEATNIPRDPFYGAPGGILIPRWDNLDPDQPTSASEGHKFRRGISFQGLGGRIPVPADSPAVFGLGSFGEMLPRYDNVVGVSRRTDRWGVPIPRIDITLGDNDRILLRHSMDALREMVDEAGYRINFIGSTEGLATPRVWPDFNPLQRMIFKQGMKLSFMLGAAIHETGGARMGDDPASSVVNGVNQLWDAPNVFVPDAASFVSGGTVGPALTIMALSARAGAFAADQLSDGSLARATTAAKV